MKTFKQLTIGDVFYKVFTNYQGEKEPLIQTINVTKISGEDGTLRINQREGYDSRNSYSFKALLVDSDCTKYKFEDGYFTTNKEELNQILKEVALSFIAKYEQKIKNENDKIIGIRKSYFEYLNIAS